MVNILLHLLKEQAMSKPSNTISTSFAQTNSNGLTPQATAQSAHVVGPKGNAIGTTSAFNQEKPSGLTPQSEGITGAKGRTIGVSPSPLAVYNYGKK